MGNDRVDFLNTTLAGKVTKKLYAEQKNKTNTIKANIWNDFIGKIGTGKTIKNEIPLKNAVDSITKYAVVEASKQNKTAEDVAREWLGIVGLELSEKALQASVEKAEKQVNEKTSVKGNTPFIDPECEKAFYREDGTLEYVNEYPNQKSDTLLKTTYYKDGGKTKEYDEEFFAGTDIAQYQSDYVDDQVDFTNIRNEQGQWTEQIQYRKNGTVETVNKYNPEKAGEIKTTIHYKEDGKTVEYDEEYFQGTKVVFDQTDYVDGKPQFSNLHNDKGQWVEQVNYKDDGTCVVNQYNPDKPGKIISTTHYAEDGVTVIK